WQYIQPLLPVDRPHNGHRTVVKLGETQSQTKQLINLPSNKLIHKFKHASLHLKLQIEHHVKAVDPSGITTWSDNDYKFFTPIGLQKDFKTIYEQSLEKIAESHKQMRQKLENYYEKHLLSAKDAADLPSISDVLL